MTRNHTLHILRNSLLFSVICFMILLSPVMTFADPVPKLSDPNFSEAFIDLVGEHDVSATPQQAAKNPYITERLIVKSRDAHLDPDKYGAVDAIQNRDGVYILQFDSSEKARAAEKLLKTQAATEYVEPDSMVFVSDESGVSGTTGTSDEEEDHTWDKEQMMFSVYGRYIKDHQLGRRKVVAVLDTGISFTHPLLTNRLLKDKAKSFVLDPYSEDDIMQDPDESKETPNIRDNHGTHVAGIIAKCTDGFDVDILPVRVITSEGSTPGGGSLTSLVEGIKYAVAQGADVINLSIGGPGPRSVYLEECIHETVSKGVVVVSCAGNQRRDIGTESSGSVIIPAYIDECVVVGSVDRNKVPAYKSNYGARLDVIAPGVDIWSSVITKNGDAMGYLSGTSQAAPHVSALAALLRMTYPNASPYEIESLIRINAEHLGEDPHFGQGFAYFGKLLRRTITFLPGEHGRFAANTHTTLYSFATPAAPDTQGEEGYVFDGWTPSMSSTVRDNVKYTAKWKKIAGPSQGTKASEDAGPSQSAKASEDIGPSYTNSRPQANVSYTVPLKKRQSTKKLKVIGLKDGDQVVTWKSSNKAKAAVTGKPDGSCVIKAGKRAGTVKITAKTASGRSVVFRLKIQKGAVKTKKIRISSKEIRLSAGKKYKLQPVLYPITSKDGVRFTSGNKKVVSVSKTGKLTARTKGTAYVKIKSGKKTLTVKVIVRENP